MVTRLAEQKGIDLLFEALPALLQARDFALVVLGSGEARYEAFFAELARRFRGPGVLRSGYNEPLAHLIEAGSDMFLMPSRYEPCGLNQMYSLRYGTIPIVRKPADLRIRSNTSTRALATARAAYSMTTMSRRCAGRSKRRWPGTPIRKAGNN